jgi:N-acyl amino acid synthase of PEP-CTERM/exosortase system
MTEPPEKANSTDPRPPTAGGSLAELYWKYFSVADADTPELRDQAHRLRYQVYCMEHPFEPPNAEEMERDDYDAHSDFALLTHRQTGLLAGTVRMVLPRPDALERSFAFQELCTDPAIRDPRRFPTERTGEISRFCVAKQFRRRVQDRALIDLPANSEFDEGEWRRVIPNMTLGLICWLVGFSRAKGLTHWCAVMEPHLLRLLARLGIHFEPLGELVEFHGRRQPCATELEPMLRRVQAERPDIWSVIAAPPGP